MDIENIISLPVCNSCMHHPNDAQCVEGIGNATSPIHAGYRHFNQEGMKNLMIFKVYAESRLRSFVGYNVLRSAWLSQLQHSAGHFGLHVSSRHL